MPGTDSRQLSALMQVSLAGYCCDPSGDMSFAHKPHDDAEWNRFVSGNASSGGTLLFGRTTYKMMAAWWPTPLAAQATPEVAAGMNAAEKVVFSRSLKSVDWANTTRVGDHVVGTVRRMKGEPGPDMAVVGSASLVTQLADAEEIDTLQIVVHPVALGAGRSICDGLTGRLNMELTNSRVFGNGTVVLWYTPQSHRSPGRMPAPARRPTERVPVRHPLNQSHNDRVRCRR
jgi:dihydrofolate reductase